jgi:tRNA (adenine37-N6)-methyltransferase
MDSFTFEPIGIIRTPFTEPKGMPIQPSGAKGIPGTVKVSPEYTRGLKDVEGFSHLVLLYVFHHSQGYSLEVKPFLDDKLRGVFATRAPKRPNPIGFSIVRLVKVDANTLYIEDIDVVDGTPLLDIKPFVPDFDNRESEKTGWLSKKAVDAEKKKSDSRFT